MVVLTLNYFNLSTISCIGSVVCDSVFAFITSRILHCESKKTVPTYPWL